MKIHFVTGATGFVGRNLVSALLNEGETVWIIIRNLDGSTVEMRAKKIFSKQLTKYPNNFKVLKGDILDQNLGISKEICNELKHNDTVFWHLAANLSFSKSDKSTVNKTNYEGTVNVVDFANKTGVKFMHMSTAYVCGNHYSFTEEELDVGQKHRNQYEKSKLRGEQYVRENCDLPYVIFRPSIIIGDAYIGKAEGCTFGYYRFTFMFHFLKKSVIGSLQKDKLPAKILDLLGTNYHKSENVLDLPWLVIPYPKTGRVNMIPIDYVINSMVVSCKNNLKGITLNLTHPEPPEFNFVLKNILYDMGINKTKLIPVKSWVFKSLIHLLYVLVFPIRKYTKHVSWYIPYISKRYFFDRINAQKYLGNPPKITRKFLHSINTYAKENILEHIKV